MEPAIGPAHNSLRHLFIYGTLQPGDVRWPQLEPFVVGEGCADTVPGELFDTGLAYPAALFNGRATIHGHTYELRPEALDTCLIHLDRVERTVQGLYSRVIVTTSLSREAWAYEYGSGLDLVPIRSGDWTNR